MGGYAVPFLNEALKDKDPVVREQALLIYSQIGNAIQKLDEFLQGLDSLFRGQCGQILFSRREALVASQVVTARQVVPDNSSVLRGVLAAAGARIAFGRVGCRFRVRRGVVRR